jgi:urease accessory protein
LNSALLLLGDGRFPAGGHSHSGGLEEAVGALRVQDSDDLFAFLTGRLATTGRVDAAIAAAAWAAAPSIGALITLDAEAVARCPSPALRQASRAQGRGLLRAARSLWPAGEDRGSPPSTGVVDPAGRVDLAELANQLPHGPMHPVALGAVGRHVGLNAEKAALLAAQASVNGPAWAATRLLGLDPFAVGRCLARLSRQVEGIAAGAATMMADGGDVIEKLPAHSAPLLEIGAENHAKWEVQLFAS